MTMITSKIFSWDNHKNLDTIALDSLIVGGFAAAATLGNTIPGLNECYTAVKAFTLAFLAQLAFERGIKQIRGK